MSVPLSDEDRYKIMMRELGEIKFMLKKVIERDYPQLNQELIKQGKQPPAKPEVKMQTCEYCHQPLKTTPDGKKAWGKTDSTPPKFFPLNPDGSAHDCPARNRY